MGRWSQAKRRGSDGYGSTLLGAPGPGDWDLWYEEGPPECYIFAYGVFKTEIDNPQYGQLRMRLSPVDPWDEDAAVADLRINRVGGRSYCDHDATPPKQPDGYWYPASEGSVRWGPTLVPGPSWSDWSPPKTGILWPP